MSTEILRYAAFTDRPEGGNPAGVVLDASGLDDAAMQAIAADVGYSETAFVTAADGSDLVVRYFSPLAEVPFCGHATIATGVAWGDRFGDGLLKLTTPAGLVEVDVADGVAKLTSVAPSSAELGDADLDELLGALGWARSDLDPSIPPRVAYAGAHHPVLAAAASERLAELDYDFDRLGALMAARDWTTIQLVHREGPDRFRSRNPFPPGGVVEDPATGAAAAAFGGYLRELGAVSVPAAVTIDQGIELGRPSLLAVTIPAGDGGISVAGTAVPI
jgi:PhzF family phenazine biosynthesis protein